jgi:hypothetical protein
MKKLIPVFGLFLAMAFGPNLIAQEEEQATYYHVLEYMKVEPGGEENYEKLEAIWKKIHAANVKAGKYVGWELSSVVFPTVSSSEYNFVTRTVFRGAKQLGDNMENWSMPDNLNTLLTADELKMVNTTDEYRTMVKREVWTIVDMITAGEPNEAKIMVFNFFKSPEGKSRSDHFQIEENIWKPVHQSRIDVGEMQVWGVVNMELPWGSDYAYDSGSIDGFRSVEEFLASGETLFSHFEKAHSGKDIDKMMAETGANSDLVKSEIRKILDFTWAE